MSPGIRAPGFRLRDRYLLPLDAAALTAAAIVSHAAGLESPQSSGQVTLLMAYVALTVPLKLALLVALRLYRRLWRHAGIADLQRLVLAGLASGGVGLLVGRLALPILLPSSGPTPIAILLLDAMLGAGLLAVPRVLARASSRRARRRRDDARRVLIAGAGSVGETIAKELNANPQLGLTPVGFVDDDRAKHGRRMCGLPVFGGLERTCAVVLEHGIGEVVIAMPSASGPVIRNVVEAARAAGAQSRTVPGLADLLSGRVSVSALRKVRIDDLLRREPVRTDLEQIRELAAGETVLVTGAGGSIGSELCRQLARLTPARLVLLGHGEHSIFETANDLTRRFPDLEQVRVIADVRNRAQLQEVWDRVRPFAVFHAAAHKHVPLMEENVAEAITNNILGTYNVLQVSAEFEAEHLVMISTDKAVKPANVMGATKRVAEQIVQATAERTGRNFVAVRFGNVLGSRGSVVPTFLRQIAEGGPLTITHPEMTRYFMTIPEAVQLVLQAAAIGRGGEVFVLDMGRPVKIAELAADLIRLSGLEVGRDIELCYTGLRPGEKLAEELFFGAEHAIPTHHPKVLRARHAALPSGSSTGIGELVQQALRGGSEAELRRRLHQLLPDFPAPAAAPAAGAEPVKVPA